MNIKNNKSYLGFTLAEGATHVDLPPTKVKFGFTLAEILITLGIIGVVARLETLKRVQGDIKVFNCSLQVGLLCQQI